MGDRIVVGAILIGVLALLTFALWSVSRDSQWCTAHGYDWENRRGVLCIDHDGRLLVPRVTP
jgi:hypothetical protein